MSERARHLAERVFPEDVRVRQWVLSLPFDLRWRAAFDHPLARRLAGLLQAAIARRYRRLAREAGLSDPQGGAVLVMQRFSSDLRTNLHFHLASLDGAYGTDPRGQRRFETAPAPSPADVEAILRDFLQRARALLDAADDAPPDDEDQLALAHTLAAASTRQDAEAHAPDDGGEQDGQLHLPTRRKGPQRAPGVAPRAPMRPARQAHRGAIVGRWRRGATPRAGMQRRPNADGGSERT